MKKVVSLLLFLLITTMLYSQNAQTNEAMAIIVRDGSALLGQPVPQGSTRLGQSSFRSACDNRFLLGVHGGVVVEVDFGFVFPTTHDALDLHGAFIDFFETNWEFRIRNSHGEYVYDRGNIRAFVVPPFRRDDGLIASMFTLERRRQ